MNETLFTIIKDKVYKSEEIRNITLASQDKESAWIFDFKNQALSKVFLREYSKHFWEFVRANFEGNSVQIGGMETGAIALIAGVSLGAPEEMRVNSFYIRKSRKKSDLANLVEGEILKDVPIILVDDLINKGRTTNKQIKILEDMGHSVSAVFTCLRFRDMDAYKYLTDKGIKVESIFELNDFSKELPVKNRINDKSEAGHIEKYSPAFKVSLTDKPNLYSVLPKSGPVLVDDFIYMGADSGSFYCLRKSDGGIVWEYKIAFGSKGKRIFSTPVVGKDTVIFGAYDGNLYCLDRFTGERKWVFLDADWIGSSPSVDKDRGIVFVGLEFGLFKKGGGVVAVDIRTGKALWKNYGMEEWTHASPVVNSKLGVVVCGCNDHYIYCFDHKAGQLLWKFKTKGEVKYGAVFDEKRGFVIVGSMDGKAYVLRVKDGSLYHAFEARFGFYSTAVLTGDRIVIGSLDKIVYCFNIATKQTEWTFETAGRIFASPILFESSIYIGSNDGALYELNKNTGELICRIQFSERIVNRICVEKDIEGKKVLYIPTHTCELYKMVEI